MQPRTWHWIVGAIVYGVALSAALWLSPRVLPIEDPMGMYRETLARFNRSAQGLLILVGSVLFFDWITPGDWFEGIHENSVASAIVVAVLLYVLGIGFIA